MNVVDRVIQICLAFMRRFRFVEENVRSRDTPQKCHFTLGFCKGNFSISGCPSFGIVIARHE